MLVHSEQKTAGMLLEVAVKVEQKMIKLISILHQQHNLSFKVARLFCFDGDLTDVKVPPMSVTSAFKADQTGLLSLVDERGHGPECDFANCSTVCT